MNMHKEENKVRTKNDLVNKNKFKSLLITCIHPLLSESHTLCNLCNIYTGEIAGETFNGYTAVEIARKLMTSFQRSLLEGFR